MTKEAKAPSAEAVSTVLGAEPIHAQVKWIIGRIALEFVGERSQAWAMWHQDELQACMNQFTRAHQHEVVVDVDFGEHSDAPNAVTVACLLAMCAAALREAFPDTELHIEELTS